MRLFIAAPVTDAVRGELRKLIKEAQDFAPAPKKLKWVEPENFHFTLKFLGETPEDRAAELKTCLQETANEHPAFKLELEGVGFFPKEASPRVLWVGAKDPKDQLDALARSIDEITLRRGFPPADKPFSPHLTLARFGFPPSGTYLKNFEPLSARAFGNQTVDRICLMQSRLSASGPVYSEMESCRLK